MLYASEIGLVVDDVLQTPAFERWKQIEEEIFLSRSPERLRPSQQYRLTT